MSRCDWILAALLAAGCASATPPAEEARPARDGASGYCAQARFPSDLDRACAASGDCVVVMHQIDCCGGAVAMAIGASERARADAAEARVAATCPALCECLATMRLEDGTTVADVAGVAAVCEASRCTARPARP